MPCIPLPPLQRENQYFVHFFCPSGLRRLWSHTVFLMDVSQSMGAAPGHLQQILRTLLDPLTEEDTFEVRD